MRARAWVAYLVFSICALLYLYPFVKVLFLPDADEGSLLYGAIRVIEGQVPFRDFFEVMGPGSFYWLAGFFKLFGTTVAASRVPVALVSLGIAVLMYFLARRLDAAYAALPAAFLMTVLFAHFWPAVSYHTESTLFALLSFACLVLWLDTNRPSLLWLAGVLAGATTLFLQPKGLFLIVSFLFVVLLLRGGQAPLASLAMLIGGYVSVLATVVLLYWKAGALSDFVYADIVWPLQNYGVVNDVPYGQGLVRSWMALQRGLEHVWPPVIASSIATLLRVPQFVVAALPLILVVLALCYKRSAFDRLTLPYWLAGIALWLSELHRKDMSHLIYGSPLFIILFCHFLIRDRRRSVRRAVQALCGAVIVLAAFNLLLIHTSRKVNTPRGTLYAFGSDPVLDFLDSHVTPGEDIFVYPYRPIYYFLTRAENPTRFSILVYHMHTRSQFHEAVNSLKQNNVRYVIWEHSPIVFKGFPAGYSEPPADQLIMEPYLATQYRVLKSFKGIDVLEPKTGASESQGQRKTADAEQYGLSFRSAASTSGGVGQ